MNLVFHRFLLARSGPLVAALLAGVSVSSTTMSATASQPAPVTAQSQSVEPVESVESVEPVEPVESVESVESLTGPLRVKADPSIDDASLMPQWVAEQNSIVAGALALPGHEQWLEVEIGGATYDYRVTVTPMRDGVPIGPAVTPVRCECNSEGLLALVGQEIAKAVELAESLPVEVEEPEPEPEPEPTPEPEPPKRLGRVGIGGIVIGSLGIAALAGGAAMVVIGERHLDETPAITFVRDYRPVGIATLSGGATALLVGATMLAVDLTRCKRRPGARGCSGTAIESPTAASRRRPHLSAVFLPGTAGLSIHGSF